jgi:hypothetical protein
MDVENWFVQAWQPRAHLFVLAKWVRATGVAEMPLAHERSFVDDDPILCRAAASSNRRGLTATASEFGQLASPASREAHATFQNLRCEPILPCLTSFFQPANAATFSGFGQCEGRL